MSDNATNFDRDWNAQQNLKDQVAEAGAELKQRATDALRTSADVGRAKAKEAAEAIKSVAADATDKVQDKAREQQRSSADFIERLAGDIRIAARAFDEDAPVAARGFNSAASYAEDAAETIRNGNFRDLVDGATDFAKRQPAVFLGISVLAGFAAIRFFKASEGPSSLARSPSGDV